MLKRMNQPHKFRKLFNDDTDFEKNDHDTDYGDGLLTGITIF
jgi:hypothetical protein